MTTPQEGVNVPPAASQTLSLPEIRASITQAKADLQTAEAEEAKASAAVDDAHQGVVLNRIVRSALLAFQKSLASRQEDVAQAQSAVRAYERLEAEELARIEHDASRLRGETIKRLQLDERNLRDEIGALLATTAEALADIDAAVAAHNREREIVSLGVIRPPSAYGTYERLVNGVHVMLSYFPAPKEST